jgi:5-methylcytosine-specific restriction endonuclease McrA
MSIRREKRRQRYREDPTYRERSRERNRRYRAAHRDKINEQKRRRWALDGELRSKAYARRVKIQRKTHLKLTYGISVQEYEAMLAQQGGLCAICNRKFDKPLHVDHCHATNAIRGLLCRNCNVGLGCYEDNPALFQRAKAYLKAFRQKQKLRIRIVRTLMHRSRWIALAHDGSGRSLQSSESEAVRVSQCPRP